MTLNEHAETMGTGDGHASTRPPIRGLTDADIGSVHYFALFPNALVSLHPDYVMLHTLWPRAVDRTEVTCEWFFEPETMAAEDFDPSDAVEFWDTVNRQDWGVCELTQTRGADPRLRRRPLLGRRVRRPRVRHARGRAIHGGAAKRRGGLDGTPRGPGGSWQAGGVNRIAAQLGEVGLPEPVAEMASREWDAVIVGGGHNGLTAAAYLARAGSVGARARAARAARRRLHARAPLRRRALRDQPLRVRARPARRSRDRGARPARRGLRWWIADPNLWIPFADGTSLGQFVDDDRTHENLRELGVSKADIDGYFRHQKLYDDVRRRAARGRARRLGGRLADPRAEIEEMLGGDREMIDLVFEASIAEVMDDHFRDQRLHDALFGGGVIGTWAGPRDPGTASVKLMHHQGNLDGAGLRTGPTSRAAWGWSASRSPTPPREAGRRARLRRPGRRPSTPARGSSSRTARGSAPARVICNADPKVALRPARRGGDRLVRRRLPRAARGLEGAQPGGQVQRGARPASGLDRGRRARAGPRGR